MACDSVYTRTDQTQAERRAEIASAIDRLEKAIGVGIVRLAVSAQGALAVSGWTAAERRGITDACGLRALARRNSWAYRQALARAEAIAGRKADARQIAAGVHSHDGGRTWGTH